MLCRLISDCWIRQTRVGSCIDLEKSRSRRRSVRSGSEATIDGGGGISRSAVLLHLDG
uniref:Uncharacterized protein n=1 Tax=Zea mays TaxID=4577 RepID=B6SYH5_MAIZE|nr:hypothetical protein [Zea mays]ACG30059.1 hypothetical protein [Zea mays]ACG30653.1 hypothetical protein [Zea mays]ACG30781.1 hypothetical protein [Zea mays]